MGHADFLAGRSGTVDGLVRWRAADSPDKVYAESGSRAVTYGDLDATAGGLAGALTELGVGKGDFVAIYMNNGLEYALSMFACFRLGAVCVPCSTHYTADELVYQLSHSQTKLVVTDAPHAALLADVVTECPGVREVVCLANDVPDSWHSFAEIAKADLGAIAAMPTLSASDPALVIYTSGTTARPKGVLATQGNLITTIENTVATYQLAPDDRILHFFPMFHLNGGVVCLLPALAVGATVVMLDRFSASAFGRQLHDLGITYCNINSTHVKMVLASAPTHHDSSHRARRMLLGLSLEKEQREQFERRFRTRLCPTYGMTETLGVVASESPGGPRRDGGAGRVLRGYEVDIRDTEHRSLATGEVGRICVRSLQRYALAASYLNNSELTDETFVDGWLLTGDLGYVDDDGFLFCIGRLNDVIKRSGYNVAPAEIERVIGEIVGVKDVAVVSAPDRVREEAIVAFVTAEHEIAERDILEACMNKLAPYKVPQVVKIVDELPLTFIGKIDRTQLRALASREVLPDGKS